MAETRARPEAGVNGLDHWQRLMWRAALRPESLLSLEETAGACPGRDKPAERWITANVTPAGQIAGNPVYLWRDVLTAMGVANEDEEITTSTAPISTWRGVATALGVSEDTVARHRAKYGDQIARPWFRDADEVAEWWRQLHEPPKLRRTAHG